MSARARVCEYVCASARTWKAYTASAHRMSLPKRWLMRLADAEACTRATNWPTRNVGRFSTYVGRTVAQGRSTGQFHRMTQALTDAIGRCTVQDTCSVSTDAQCPSICITCGTYCGAGLQHRSVALADAKSWPSRLAGAAEGSVGWWYSEGGKKIRIFSNHFIFLCFSHSNNYLIIPNKWTLYCTVVTQFLDIFGSRIVKERINSFVFWFTHEFNLLFLTFINYCSVLSRSFDFWN